MGNKVRSECYGRVSPTSPRPPDLDTLFAIGSVTKTFTATLLALRVHQGSVTLDDPVKEFVPRRDSPNRLPASMTFARPRQSLLGAPAGSGAPRLGDGTQPGRPLRRPGRLRNLVDVPARHARTQLPLLELRVRRPGQPPRCPRWSRGTNRILRLGSRRRDPARGASRPLPHGKPVVLPGLRSQVFRPAPRDRRGERDPADRAGREEQSLVESCRRAVLVLPRHAQVACLLQGRGAFAGHSSRRCTCSMRIPPICARAAGTRPKRSASPGTSTPTTARRVSGSPARFRDSRATSSSSRGSRTATSCC